MQTLQISVSMLFLNEAMFDNDGRSHKNQCLLRNFFLMYIFFIHFPFWQIRATLPWKGLQQPQEQRYLVQHVHAGSFHVIHRTLTWTTGSLMCVHNHSYLCIYTRGLGTPTSQHIFDSWGGGGGGGGGDSHIFHVLLTGFKPQVLGSQVRCSTN